MGDAAGDPPPEAPINTAHPFSGAPPAPAGDPFKLAGARATIGVMWLCGADVGHTFVVGWCGVVWCGAVLAQPCMC